MPRFLLPLLFLPVTLAAFSSPTLTVLPLLESNTDQPLNSGSDAYLAAFTNSHRLLLVAPDKLSSATATVQKASGGLFSMPTRTLAAIGKQAGAQIVAVGRLSGSTGHWGEYSHIRSNPIPYYGVLLMLEVRFIDVARGEVRNTLFIDTKKTDKDLDGVTKDAYSSIQGDLTDQIQRIYPLHGVILKSLNEKEYLINIGTSDGLEEENDMQLFEDTPPIKDPVTGRQLQGEHNLIGTGVISKAADDSATLKISKLTAPIVPGQTKVELKP